MINLLASAFRTIFGILAWGFIFLVAGTGIWRMTHGTPDERLLGLGVAVGGTALAILCFGLTAIIIQNNDLLRQIQKSLGRSQEIKEDAGKNGRVEPRLR